jgi:gas vesicle protein
VTNTSQTDPYRDTPAGSELTNQPASGDYAFDDSTTTTDVPPSDYPGVVQTDRPVGAYTETDYSQADLSTSSGTSGSSTKDVAKNEAANVKDTAVDAGKNVASTAKGEAANVVQETKQQAKSLLDTVGSEVRGQAGNQQQRIATAVHSLSKELGSMASSSSESGPLTDLAHQASRKGGEIAHWLENREPRDVLEELKRFGRRRPVMFLGLCALAGVVAGRLARGAVAANTELDSPNGRRDTAALTSTTYPSNYEAGYHPGPTGYTTGSASDYAPSVGTLGTSTGTATGYEGSSDLGVPPADPSFDDATRRSDRNR